MSNEPKAGKGIDPEMLAAYIDNRLPPEQRAAVEAQLATDPESRALLVDTIEALEDDEIKALEVNEPLKQPIPFAPKAPKKSPFRSLVIAGGALAAAAAIALVVIQPTFLQRYFGSEVDPRFEQLVAAVGDERYFEARLTGGFHYGPLRSATRGPGELARQNLGLLAAAGNLQKAAASDSGPSTLHAWGIAQLLLGEYDGAVVTLEQAARASADSAQFHSDLAAAYLTRAKVLDRPDDIPRALAEAERAITKNPSQVEALHNKALALEMLFLVDEAIEIWQRLERELTGGWSAAAAANVKRLQRPRSSKQRWEDLLARQDRSLQLSDLAGLEHEARRWLRLEALPKRIEAGVGKSADTVEYAREVSVATMLAAGDPFDLAWLDSASKEAEGTGPPNGDMARTFASLLARSGSFELVDQLQIARDFQRTLKGSGHPLEGWSVYLLADALRLAGEPGQALSLVADARSIGASRGFRSLVARTYWLEGSVLASQRRHSDAIVMFVEARRSFAAASELVSEGRLWSQLASTRHLLGDDREGWRNRITALGIALVSADPGLAEVAFNGAAGVALDRDYPEVAVAFLSAQSSGSAAVTDAIGFAQVNLRLAEAYGELSRFEDAWAAMRQARSWMDLITLPRVQANAESLARDIQANLHLRQNDLRAANDVATDGLKRGMRNQLEAASMLIIRSATAPDGAMQTAAADLADALSRLETFYRGRESLGVPDSDRRNAFLAGRRVIGQLMASGADVDAALLADRLQVATGLWRPREESIRLHDLLAGATKTLIVHYFPTEHDTVVWVISHRGVQSQVLSVATAELAELADEIRLAAEQRDTRRFNQRCTVLYQRLIDPIATHLFPGANIVFVGPGPLQGVPFAALGPAGGARLFDSYEIAVATSLRSLGPHNEAKVSAGTAMVVGSPGGTPPWSLLPGVSRELELVRTMSPRLVLEGPEATVDSVLAGLAEQPSMFHFAGHALVDFSRPSDSGFVLAGGAPTQFAYLRLGDLLSKGWRSPSIVLLSACATGQQPSRHLEASGGMAAAFMSMGAEVVVATLWDLNDSSAPNMFAQLHRSLRAGTDPAAALRRAQQAAAREMSEFPDYLGVVTYVSSVWKS